ncbi:hypothetical protein CBL_09818 [Carabus blaptoides fortunei]
MKIMWNVLCWTRYAAIELNAKFVYYMENLADKLTNRRRPEDLYSCYFLFEDGIRGHDTRSDKVYNMLDLVIEFINEAKESIDMCFYLITDYSIVEALVSAKERNVKVRIITDYTSGILNNKFAKYFYKERFPVYIKMSNPGHTIMHHKFAIKDGNTVFQCSMNLTKNTTKGSYDNVLISRVQQDVKPFIEHLELLTKTFKRT